MFAPGEISARLYVNLDNPQCTASADIVIHELGHALGMGAHFAGFGDDDAIGPAFWPVLATLYGNPSARPRVRWSSSKPRTEGGHHEIDRRQAQRLGESTVNLKNEIVKYSLIQIGDQTLTNVSVDRKLNNFLADGIETDQPTKLWLLNGGKIVMGVQVGSDTRYYGTINPFFYFAMLFNVGLALVLGAALHPLAGLAWAFFIYMVGIRKLLDCRKVAAVGGMKV